MSINAVYVMFDDLEYLDLSLSTVTQVMDQAYILLNEKTWRGNYTRDTEQVKKDLTSIVDKYPGKVQVIETNFNEEHEQRNFGIEISRQNGFEWSLIIDTDEFYTVSQLQMLKHVPIGFPGIQSVNSVSAHWYTYWKYQDKTLYVISPPEGFRPIILIDNNRFIFTDKRSGSPVNGDFQTLSPPFQTLAFHHFSYCRSDEYIQKKLATTSHSHEILPDWYKKVWLDWKPGMRNLHPVSPGVYQTAVPVDMNTLPVEIQEHFKGRK
jgi:hypothetical protein